MGCGQLFHKETDARRYRKMAQNLPLIRGTIIKDDGTTVDLADIFDIAKSSMDPQLAKAQNIFPYIRDTVVLEDGKTCSLTEILHSLLFGKGFTIEHYQLKESDWEM